MRTSESSPRPRPSAGRIVGEILLTIGVVLLLFVTYEAFWTNLASARLQEEATAELEESWAGPATLPDRMPAPALGEAFTRIHLPALGPDAAYTVVEGTRTEDLRTGPGHYVGTQLPGEPGNTALAGHRNGSGGVFQHIDRLGSCDAVVVETATQWLTYRVLPVEPDGPARRETAGRCLTPEQVERVAVGDYAPLLGRHVTTPYAVEVVDPLPGTDLPAGPELLPLLTLTTCHPQFSNAERLIVHAALVETTDKSAGPPAALEG